MKSAKIILEKLKEKGIDNAEKVVVDCFKAVQEAMPEIVIDAESSALEKSVAGVAVPVLAALMPSLEKISDFDKDGKVG